MAKQTEHWKSIMNNSADKALEIREVSGKRALNAFIRVPWMIYKNDPNWIPPLLVERKKALSPNHPFFKHVNWRAWIDIVMERLSVVSQRRLMTHI